MDAASMPTWTYLRRVLRWWAGKGPAARQQTIRPTAKARIIPSATNGAQSFSQPLSAHAGTQRPSRRRLWR
ncbi:hypothetical protein DZD52_07035 [Xanthomonas nasturtii]|uniref:Uncharacterized protein n=1 Tax=Xanthomonas nasturtii TaxID=1843581 RepID=A0A3E1KMT9_9XANT|nr:hypothetical protein DZD52_07035 [Xanthomonas nasturtii]